MFTREAITLEKDPRPAENKQEAAQPAEALGQIFIFLLFCVYGARYKMYVVSGFFAVFALVAFAAVGMALADNATPPLTCETEYFFVGAVIDGTLFAWAGPVSGDVDGIIMWWLTSVSPHPVRPPAQAGQMSFRWEIWDGEWTPDMESWDGTAWEDWYNGERVLSLAGDEKERTIVRHGKNSVWRANGIVTEASAEYEDYVGSQAHDGGNFTWAAPGVPDHGFGTLRIAGSHSKAAPGRHSTSATSWGNIKSGQ